MNLLLTGTWEHALLAMVTKEAAEVTRTEGGYLGRTAIQKILYFLQALDVPMRYRFDVYHYGPFCNNILGDIEWLMADDVIVDSSNKPGKYSRYTPGSACEELIDMHADKIRDYREKIKNTVQALLPLEPDHLELIATLDYAFREKKATFGGKPPKDVVISRFREFKGTKFSEMAIYQTYEQLESAGLFD
jgi:uncharacterized protein YwgA